MTRIVPFPKPAERPHLRTAVLDLVTETGLGVEEQEFLDALRRIVARTPAQELWDQYHGSRRFSGAGILARYAD